MSEDYLNKIKDLLQSSGTDVKAIDDILGKVSQADLDSIKFKQDGDVASLEIGGVEVLAKPGEPLTLVAQDSKSGDGVHQLLQQQQQILQNQQQLQQLLQQQNQTVSNQETPSEAQPIEVGTDGKQDEDKDKEKEKDKDKEKDKTKDKDDDKKKKKKKAKDRSGSKSRSRSREREKRKKKKRSSSRSKSKSKSKSRSRSRSRGRDRRKRSRRRDDDDDRRKKRDRERDRDEDRRRSRRERDNRSDARSAGKCRNILQGRVCPHGDGCRYSHDMSDFVPRVACRYWERGSCGAGEKCTFGHWGEPGSAGGGGGRKRSRSRGRGDEAENEE